MDGQMELNMPVTVELPQAIGGKVFTTFYGGIQEHTITGYKIGEEGVTEVYYKDKPSDSDWVVSISGADFSYEDAYRRLKEEDNG